MSTMEQLPADDIAQQRDAFVKRLLQSRPRVPLTGDIRPGGLPKAASKPAAGACSDCYSQRNDWRD